MMKKYQSPNFELINVLSADVITTSPASILSKGEAGDEMNIGYGAFFGS